MKLEKLRTLHRQIARELENEIEAASLFYFFGEKWHELHAQAPVDEAVAQALGRSKSEAIAYHSTSSPIAWFYFSDADCVVSLRFSNSPQLITRKRFRERLSKIRESATNAYKVTHHALTHLLAKEAFQRSLDEGISTLSTSQPTGADTQESGVSRTLAVVALDIDHFKQVNDTWGHLYGDQVLKTFGIRLERVAERIAAKGTGGPSVYLGHPSGEEFLILVAANATRQQFAEWANEFRLAISENILPSESEWEWLASQASLGALMPPPLQERAITTSVGVALYARLSPQETSTESSTSLLDRADTALYRAKAAGRNQVIFYDDILSSCGRVLEQDQSTRIVAIDIGLNVGVSVGQEFKVFPPTFTGHKKFALNDGRTTRTLGIYPRVENARVVVFNVQPEISFAVIAPDEDAGKSLDVGSHLEAIPAGSIGHLLSTRSRYFPTANGQLGGGSLQQLHSYIKESAQSSASPFAVVLRFTREPEYLKKYGTAPLNQALARLFRSAQTTFHAAKFVELLDRGSICVVGPKAAYKESMVIEYVNVVAADFPELGLFAGIFCEDDYQSSKAAVGEALSPEHAVEFARFAASEYARKPDTRARHFSAAVAAQVVQELREAGLLDTAYADFERLRTMGVETSTLFNFGGLVAGALGKKKEAAEHYAAAIAKAPATVIFRSNFTVAIYRLGEIEPALKVMAQLSTKEIDELKSSHSFGYTCYARLLAKAKLAGSPLFDGSRFAQVAQSALALPESTSYPEESQVIKDALVAL